jgi:hypothetical protein
MARYLLTTLLALAAASALALGDERAAEPTVDFCVLLSGSAA